MPPFEIPADILAQWRAAGARGRPARLAWEQRLAALDPPNSAPSSSAARAASCRPSSSPPPCASVKQSSPPRRRRSRRASASEFALEALIAGAAGNGRRLGRPHRLQQHPHQGHEGASSAADYAGRFIHYGVREHGMAAAMNGMALHGGIIPYSGTFLVFSDYCRPAIRLAALMGQRVIHVMTHDFDRARRGRPDASAGRATRGVARHSRISKCSGRATRSRQSSAGSSRSRASTGRACWR